MYVAMLMHTCAEKNDFRQRRLNHYTWQGVNSGTRNHATESYSFLQVQIFSPTQASQYKILLLLTHL